MVNKKIIEFIKENDVKFIRLGFCDPLGNQRNISVMASELDNAFANGVSFDASSISAFTDADKSELMLFPDTNALSLLPWRPTINSVLRFYCDIKKTDGTPFLNDGRQLLKNTVADMAKLGLSCQIGTECEFYLFKTDEEENPTYKTLDNGGYLDISPMDKGENIRREICLCLENMGLSPERSHHEQGPGQNEIDFKFSDVLSSADNILTFKSLVKSISSRNGVFASFMPKPFGNKSGSGMHINISLYKDGFNLFSNTKSDDYKIAQSFMAGILDKIVEITLFLNPNNNSYERFGQNQAPEYVSWAHNNRSQLIRIPAAKAGGERIELRSPDSTINPYLAYTLILRAGMMGVEKKLELPASTDANLFTADSSITNRLESLPKTLGEAANLAKESEFVKGVLGEDFLEKFVNIKLAEYEDFKSATDKEEYFKDTYFERL